MHHYPANSPYAAARVLALTLLADGAIDPRETRALERSGALERLRVSPRAFDEVLRTLCEDVDVYTPRTPDGRLMPGREMVAGMLSEIRLPMLRASLYGTMLGIVHADGVLADEESALLDLARACWSEPVPSRHPVPLR